MRLVRETGKLIAQVARDLGINEGTLGNWVGADQRRRDSGDGVLSEDERAEHYPAGIERQASRRRLNDALRLLGLPWLHPTMERGGCAG